MSQETTKKTYACGCEVKIHEVPESFSLRRHASSVISKESGKEYTFTPTQCLYHRRHLAEMMLMIHGQDEEE